MSDFETPNLEQLMTAFNQLKASVDERNAEVLKVRMEISEVSSRLTNLSRQRTVLENELKADATSLRELEKGIEKARRLELVKEEQTRLRAEFEEKAKELDALTATAKWREFAFDHQINGGKRLAVARRGILGDKRGLGKTLTSLIWSDMVQSKRVLIFAPNDVVPQFEEEIRTWAPARTIFSMRGLSKSQRDLIYPMLSMVDEFIVTLNYEAWRKDKSIVDELVKLGFDTIICDEAHRIKSSDKVTARGVFQVAYRPNFCVNCNAVDNFTGPWEKVTEKRFVNSDLYSTPVAEGAQRPSRFASTKLEDTYDGHCPKCGTDLLSTVQNVLCMTGTPILNKPQELFSLLFMCDRFKFPSEKKFLGDYCYSYAPNRWRFLTGGLDRLTKFMSEFFIARTRDEAGITLPPPAVKIYEIEKDYVKYKKQYEAERLLTQQAALLLEDGTRKDIFFILEMILRERQIMTWPAGISITDPETKQVLCKFDVEESQKIDEAMELINDLVEEEERIIIFSQFKGPLYEMHRRLQNQNVSSVMVTGDTSDHVRVRVRQDFDLKTAPEKPNWQICLATYKAFGTGINLNAARHMILLDDEWNPGMEDQAIGRIDRMNSTDQANVHIFRVKNSVDDFMSALLEEKRAIVDGFEESNLESKLRGFFQ